MHYSRPKTTVDIILLVCAILFSSLKAIHPLVHNNIYRIYTASHPLLEMEKSATVAPQKNARIQKRFYLCPFCVERFIAVVNYIDIIDLSAKPRSINYPKLVVAFVAVILPHSSRAPPFAQLSS